MQNYFNYFTEIEERFQQRRGSLLMLSTLDWALIESWHEAGVPLGVVLRGIDDAFDKHDARRERGKRRTRRINGLAWAAQSVMQAAEAAVEASTGSRSESMAEERESGFESERIRSYLLRNAAMIEATGLEPAIASRIRGVAESVGEGTLEELDRTLTVLEEKLFAGLVASSPEEELVALREQAARELAPYRGKMNAGQIKQVQGQFIQKRLLEARRLPRLSLFYMRHE